MGEGSPKGGTHIESVFPSHFELPISLNKWVTKEIIMLGDMIDPDYCGEV